MEKTHRTNDIFSMLDQASVFSYGKPVKQVEPVKKPREKKNKVKPGTLSSEEKEYAKLIGYEYNDNEDDGDDKFDFETADCYSEKPEHGYSNCNKVHSVRRGIGGFGRGRILNYDYENDYLFHRNNMKSLHNTRPIRQEQKDRVISEQLREVIGYGTSNEEIEDAFAKKFRKNTEVNSLVLKEDNSKKDSDLSCASNLNGDKSIRKSEKALYQPPALRNKNKDEEICFRPVANGVSPLGFADLPTKSSICDENNLLFGEETYKTLAPIKFHSFPDEYRGLKVESICGYGAGLSDNESAELGDKVVLNGDKVLNKDNFVICDSNKDVEVEGIVCKDIPKFKSSMIGKENKFKKLVIGRNALINSLLKKNAEAEFLEESKELLEERHFDLKSPNKIPFKSSDDCESNTINDLSGDQEGCGNNVSVNDESQWETIDSVSSMDNNCSTISSQSSDSSSDVLSSTDSTLNNSFPKNILAQSISEEQSVGDSKKTYIQSILEEKKKSCFKKHCTLGDYLSPKSLINTRGKSKKGSKLNPNAPSFIPESSTNKDNIHDFSLNDDNFPSL